MGGREIRLGVPVIASQSKTLVPGHKVGYHTKVGNLTASSNRGKDFPKVWVESVTPDIALRCPLIEVLAQPGRERGGKVIC